MKKTSQHLCILLTLSILIIIPFTGCLKQNIQLDGVEIRDYQGENLSSVNDFHDNSIKGTQYIDRATYHLTITGLVNTPQNLTYDEVINNNQHYSKVVTLHCVEGWSVTVLWEGVLVSDLLKKASPMPSAKILIFKAADGYTTSFPINYTTDNNIIFAYKINNVTLPAERGFPFQLIAESKWGYKWIKWVTEIEVSDDILYRGYWESKGYSNSGDLNSSFYKP